MSSATTTAYLDLYQLKTPPFTCLGMDDHLTNFFITTYINKKIQFIQHFVDAREPMILVVGEDGMGKSSFARYLYYKFKSSSEHLPFLIDVSPTTPTPDWILKQLTHYLEIETKKPMLDKLLPYLSQLASENKKIVLLVDNFRLIHNLNILNEWRSLMNIQPDGHGLFTTIVMISPKHLELLQKIPSLFERLSTRINLKNLSQKETYDYINFCLKKTGLNKPLFTAKACDLIQQATRGIPLRINLLCDQALKISAGKFLEYIDENIIFDVIKTIFKNDGNLEFLSTIFTTTSSNESLASLLNRQVLKKLIIDANSKQEMIKKLDQHIAKCIFLSLQVKKSLILNSLGQARFYLHNNKIESTLRILKEIHPPAED